MSLIADHIRPIHRVALWVTILWITTLTVCTGLSKIGCALQGSEDFSQFLLGLWHTTPFYPGSNRMGALLPLLATPIRSAIWNANSQMLLRAASGYLAIWSAAWVFTRFNRTVRRQTAISFAAFFLSLLVLLQFTSRAFYVALLSNPLVSGKVLCGNE